MKQTRDTIRGFEFEARTPQGETIYLEADFCYEVDFKGPPRPFSGDYTVVVTSLIGFRDAYTKQEITPTDAMVARLKSEIEEDRDILEEYFDYHYEPALNPCGV